MTPSVSPIGWVSVDNNEQPHNETRRETRQQMTTDRAFCTLCTIQLTRVSNHSNEHFTHFYSFWIALQMQFHRRLFGFVR
jgi:hypothetical protein